MSWISNILEYRMNMIIIVKFASSNTRSHKKEPAKHSFDICSTTYLRPY